jgi:hypothetical protein
MKTFQIKELDKFHPALVHFLQANYGERVSGTAVLMAIEASKWFSRHDQSLEEHHMNLVDQIRSIAQTTNRPQRVPTFWQWRSFVVEVRDQANKFSNGTPLVENPNDRKFLQAIVAHEAAAQASRIFGTDARAYAR